MRGLLRITAPVQFGRRHIAPIVRAFLDAHDGVEVELLLNDRNIDLIDEAIDVALRIGPLADSSLSARLVGHVRRLWVASPAYLKRRGVPRAPADLARHEAILGTLRGNRNGVRRPAQPRRADGPAARRRRRDPACAPRARAAASAQLLSYQVADELAAGQAGAPAAGLGAPPLPVHLVTKGRAHRAPKIDAFLDFAARRLLALPVLERERGK